MATITPFLWYHSDARKAAEHYTSIFPNSRIDRVNALPADSPSGPAGTVDIVDFTLLGQQFTAISGGPMDEFNHAVSFVVLCEDQDEIDSYWDALADGGETEPCGWVRDRFGVEWQVSPRMLGDMLADEDPVKARRVAEEMLKMGKLDLPKLEAAYAGAG